MASGKVALSVAIMQCVNSTKCWKLLVPFNSVNNLVADRNLYFDFQNRKREEVHSAGNFVSGALFEDNSNDFEVEQEIDDNRAELKDNSLEEQFVSKNIIY